MVNVVALTLDDGDNVLVEVDGGLDRSGNLVTEAGGALREAVEKVRPTLQAALANLRNSAEPPNDVTIQFGFTVRAGTASEARCTITADWVA
jgi:hypothetical protein